MKALILAGGRGSRLNEFTSVTNKSLIKLFGKSLIEYNLEQAVSVGVKEIIIVVGYKAKNIINYLGNEFKGVEITYIYQKERKGLVHAIECAKFAIGDSDFILMLGDEMVLDAKLDKMLDFYKKNNLFVVCGIVSDDDKLSIAKTYNAMVNEEGRAFRLIEKPRFPLNKIKGTGHCILKNQMLDYIDRTPINANRGERELVDWIQCAIDEGKKVYTYPISDFYVNINTKEDYYLAKEMISSSLPSVLIIHPQLRYFGGAELLIVELCNSLTKRGIKNTILTAHNSEDVQKLLINTDIIVPMSNINIPSTGFKGVKDVLYFIIFFRKQLKKIIKNYDVINFHNYPVTWTLWPYKKPCIWMLNEPPNLWSKPNPNFFLKSLNFLRYYIDKFIVANSIDIICVADELNSNRCIKRYNKTSIIIPYGVNYDFFSKGDGIKANNKWVLEDKFVVIQSGVLNEQKNQLDSLVSINQVKDKIPNLLLVLAGNAHTDYKEKLDKFIEKNNLKKHVLFTGNLNREDLRDLYKRANVGLFPIGKQGGWLAPFELLCSQNPVIVSENMGAASLIKKFNLGICTSNYAEALLNIYLNYKKYKHQALISSLFIKKNINWDVFTDNMIIQYKKAIKKHGKKSFFK